MAKTWIVLMVWWWFKERFLKASEIQKASSINFAKLLEMCALAVPEMRIRFSTSNPQDMSLDVIKK